MTDSASTPYMIKYIVAGNYEQYVEWINRKGLDPRAYRYVENKHTLIGAWNISGFFIGTYYLRSDIDEIKIAISISKRTKEDAEIFNRKFLT
jgi:hypothetical protein